MDLSLLATCLAIDFGIQIPSGIVAALKKTERFYDLVGAFSFIALSAYSFYHHKSHTTRQIIQNACVVLWAARLAVYLGGRALTMGDWRFNKIKGHPVVFIGTWLAQGVWVFVTLLPTLILNASHRDPALSTIDFVGWGVFAFGFLFEAIADVQKAKFHLQSQTKDKFITTGLWSISRHPNYFGEIVLWSGLLLPATQVFTHSWMWLGVLSPIFVTCLLLFGSGLPFLEAEAKAKWGDNPIYQAYKRRTPILVPFLV